MTAPESSTQFFRSVQQYSFKSYLEGRSYFATIGGYESDRVVMTWGVPQGSVLGPHLFSLYMLPLGPIQQNNNTDYHSYADDTQIRAARLIEF